MPNLKQEKIAGHDITFTVDPNTGHFGLITKLIPSGDEWKHHNYKSLAEATDAAKALAKRATTKIPSIGVEYFDPGTMEHWTVTKKRISGGYTIKSRGKQTDLLKYLPSFDMHRPLSTEEVAELRELKVKAEAIAAQIYQFSKTRKISVNKLVQAREQEIDAELAKAEPASAAEAGCTCGEATGDRAADTPKCAYCVTGVPLEEGE